MHVGIDGPCREVSPCKGCARKGKGPDATTGAKTTRIGKL